MDTRDAKFAKMSAAQQERMIREGQAFAKSLIEDMNTTMKFTVTAEEKRAFGVGLLVWATCVNNRHAVEGCHANVPADVLALDSPLRTLPCFVCNIVLGHEHGKAHGFLEGLLTQAATVFNGVKPS